MGRHPEQEPSVVQLGGSNPATLAEAAEMCEHYGGYGEINLNCGCPSNRVAKKCFGAQLMLNPALVREIVSTMTRRLSIPVTVKCRLGIHGERDTYENLVEFITEAHAGGANKFIIHARDCVLSGLLNTKQNRDIPPIRHDVVYRLCQEFPDLKFVLNGGIKTLEDGKMLMNDGDAPSGLSGVMIGRAAYHNPIVFAQADSTFWGVRDPCLTRREVLEKFCEYCDAMQSEEGPKKRVSGALNTVSTSVLLNAMRNFVSGLRHTNRFRTRLNDVYVEHMRDRGRTATMASQIIQESLGVLLDDDLDQPLGVKPDDT